MRQRPERLRLCRLFRLFRSPLTQSEQLNAALGAGCADCAGCSDHFCPGWHGGEYSEEHAATRPRGRVKKDMNSITLKNNRHNRHNRHNPMDMRGLAVPIKNSTSEQKGPNRNSDGRCVIFTTSCSRVKPVAPRATPKSPGWMIALSPIAPEGRWTPQTNPIQRGLASNMGAKPGLEKGQPMEPLDSRPLSALGPQSRGLVPSVERANAWKFQSKGFQSPMQDETGSKGGVLRGVGGLFRLPTQPCGTSTHTPPKNFYIFSMTHKPRKGDTQWTKTQP